MGYPAPGRMISLGTHRLHVSEPGAAEAGPTVIFEAALGGSSLSWCRVRPAVAQFARTYAYDRAGMGWSDSGPMPRSLDRMVDELGAWLDRAAAPPPYILVGHSYGGLNVWRFAERFPALTRGLVLVDAPSLGLWARPSAEDAAKLERGIRLARRGALAARCGVAHVAAGLVGIGALGLASACARVVSGGKLRTKADFNFAPMALVPQELKPAMRSFWVRAKFYEALASQMEELPAAARELEGAAWREDLPLWVLSASDATAGRRVEQDRIAALSSAGVHRVARGSGHWIPLEDPAVIVEAIRAIAGEPVPSMQ